MTVHHPHLKRRWPPLEGHDPEVPHISLLTCPSVHTWLHTTPSCSSGWEMESSCNLGGFYYQKDGGENGVSSGQWAFPHGAGKDRALQGAPHSQEGSTSRHHTGCLSGTMLGSPALCLLLVPDLTSFSLHQFPYTRCVVPQTIR